MNVWPPNPGSTVMTRMMSSSSRYGSSADSGVAGLTASPAARPAARMRRRVGAISSSISTWKVIESQPASRYSSRKRPGSSTIRCASNGSSVRGRRCLMVFAPNVRFGTKWASMTSRWIRSAPAFWTRWTAYCEVGQVGVEDARGDPGAAVGHRLLPHPDRRRVVAAFAEQGGRALGDEPGAAARDGRAPAAHRPVPRRAGRRRRRPPGRGCGGSSSRCRRRGGSPRRPR